MEAMYSLPFIEGTWPGLSERLLAFN
jgi:hypothetical protein